MSYENKKIEKKLITAALSCVGCLTTILVAMLIAGFFLYNPLMANYYYSTGLEEKKKGYPIKAKEQLSLAIKYDVNGSIGQKARNYIKYRLPKSDNITLKAINYNIEGYNYDKDKNPQKAMIAYNEAIKESPDFDWPYSNLAMVYFYYYENDEMALKLLEKALKINPSYYNARLNVGKVYFQMGKDALKAKNYTKAKSYFLKSSESYSIIKGYNFKEDEDIDKINYELEAISDYLNYIAIQTKKVNRNLSKNNY